MSTHRGPVFDIGDIVRFNVPHPKDEKFYARGMVVAHEMYADGNGTRNWWYVRWFDSEGRPEDDPTKHCGHELVQAEVDT